MFNFKSIPIQIGEAFILIPIIIIGANWGGHNNIFADRFIVWMLLYGVSLFIFRIIFTTLRPFTYSMFNLITPIYFLVFTCALYWGINKIWPSYEIGPVNISEELMAKDCPEARWDLTIRYKDKDNEVIEGSTDVMIIGNTEFAKEKTKNRIDLFLKENPKLRYRDHSLILYYLPKDLVVKNRWGRRWYEKDEDMVRFSPNWYPNTRDCTNPSGF